MRTRQAVAAALLAVSFTCSVQPIHAGSLKDIGKAAAYPVKKGAHNAGKSIKTGAGKASKSFNHAGQAVQYPVRKAGEKATKTGHQTVKDVKKKS